MTKYHISKDGKVRPCRSKGPCPLGNSFDGKGNAERYATMRAKQTELYESNVESKSSYSLDQATERAQYVDETVSPLVKAKKDTKSLYYDVVEGKYTKERQALHDEILDSLHKKHESVPSDGKVVFSAGLPGAGKTTVLNRLKDGEGIDTNEYVTVSSDDFKEILAEKGMVPKVDGLSPMEASTLVHEESSYLADRYLNELADKKKNIVYDFTCKNYKSTTSRINALTGAGYEEKDMQFVFVDIPLEVAETRAEFRYAEGLNNSVKVEGHIGGRYLPKKVLYDSKSETGRYSSKNAEALLEVYGSNKDKGMPEPIVYDNSGNSYEDPTYRPERQEFAEFSSR